MKKLFLILIAMLFVAMVSGGIHDYTAQEILNLVLQDSTLGIHGYTTGEVLNLVYDSTNEALKVTVNGGDVEVGTLNFTDATELTIATGVVTITQSVHTIDGETDADDDLVTISGGAEGDFLILYPENAARNITLINSTGNILTSNGLDTVIPDDGMAMLYYNGTNWLAFISIGADITISGDITVGGNISIEEGGELRWYDTGSSHYTGFEAPALTANQIYVLPDADGTANQILATDGSGTLLWNDEAASAEWSRTGTVLSPTNTGDDIDGTGGYLLDSQSITNLASGDAGYWLDGTTYIQLGDGTESNFIINNDATIVCKFRSNSIATSQILASFGAINAGNCIAVGVDENGYLFISNYFTTSIIDTQEIIAVNVDYIMAVAYDESATSAQLYLNGKALDSGTINITAPTGNAYIGRFINDEVYFNGTISDVKLFNTALTATEVANLYSGASVDYKYLGASQDELMSGWDLTSGWAVNLTASITDSDTYVTTSSAGNVYTTTDILELNKTYRLIVAGAVDVGSDEFSFGVRLVGGSYVEIGTGFGTHEFTTNQSLSQQRFVLSATGAVTITLTTLELTQIGQVASYESEGIGHNQWLDNSGNELNGEVSGAVPTNLPVDDVQTLVIKDITGETTKTNWLPAGYKITDIVFENETASTITALDIGFTDAGGEIVAADDVGASGQGSMTVLQRVADINADDTFYISASNWNGCTMNFYITIERFRSIN